MKDATKQQAQSIALDLIALKGQLKSSARQALAAVGKIDEFLEQLKRLEAQAKNEDGDDDINRPQS